MSRQVDIHVGVILAREAADHLLRAVRWTPAEIVLDPPPCPEWREVRRTGAVGYFHACNAVVTLSARETTAYRINLANGEPAAYVILREAPDGLARPEVRGVTLSPFAARTADIGGLETSVGVAMPAALIDRLRAFVDTEIEVRIDQGRGERPAVVATPSEPRTASGEQT